MLKNDNNLVIKYALITRLTPIPFYYEINFPINVYSKKSTFKPFFILIFTFINKIFNKRYLMTYIKTKEYN